MFQGSPAGIPPAATTGYAAGEAGSGAMEPVDRAHLARYTLGDPALEREVLGLFLAQIPLTVESLKFAATDKDWYMAAHALKGSARAVGAWKLSRLAQMAEKFGRAAVNAASAGIITEIEKATAEVESYLADAMPEIQR